MTTDFGISKDYRMGKEMADALAGVKEASEASEALLKTLELSQHSCRTNDQVVRHIIIEPNVMIGDNVEMGYFILLKSGTRIGNNVFIDSYVKTSGDCVIGDNVTLRYNCTIARETTIKDNVFISPNVMMIYSGPGAENTNGIVIEEGAYIGTAAVIGQGVRIGKGAIIGAMSYVTKDCEPGKTYVGVPAREKSETQQNVLEGVDYHMEYVDAETVMLTPSSAAAVSGPL